MTIGMPPTQVEAGAMQELAAEIVRCRAKGRAAKASVEKMVQDLEPVQRLAPVIGKTTAAVLVSKVGALARYESASSLVKALGLNLKERSSGKHQGQLKITKRGPGLCRFYLYLAALRLIMRDPVVKRWYERKVARQAGKTKNKAVVAVMRKLAAGLWHVARGEVFDSRKLFDAVKLGFEPSNEESSKASGGHKTVVGQVESVAGFKHAAQALLEAGLI
jgi:transposase